MGEDVDVNRILGALAAVMFVLVAVAPPAEARCWRVGHRWRCSPARHVVYRRPPPNLAEYEYYRPYLYQPYPYYASYPRPPGGPLACSLPFYFCW